MEGKNIVELRRIWLAYMYDNFFYTMHKKTNLPISVIYAFFIIEATNNGIESNLLSMAKIAIIEDNHTLAKKLAELLGARLNLEVCLSSPDIETLFHEGLSLLPPDIILLDINLS